jgi:Domain of unknown function (DUF1992).
MTERKPEGVEWESWVEQKIQEAMDRGDFDNLPGLGKPIADLALPYDELWWVRKKLRDEQLSVLPPALVLLKELDEAKERIAAASTEEEVRRLVAAINDRIIYVNSHTISAPHPTSCRSMSSACSRTGGTAPLAPALVVEEPGLSLGAPAVAGEAAVGADDPVAGDDDGDRVAPVGCSDRPG